MYALLVCADPDEEVVLALAVQRVGLTVTTALTLDRALENWERRSVQMVLCALPGASLIEKIVRLRDHTEVPVVVISPTASEDLLCRIYEAGADLVLTRPYSVRLLIHQLRALSRRSRGTHLLSIPPLSYGDLTLDPSTRSVQAGESPPRHLTQLEFRLLHTLMLHQGQTLTTETIVDRVWGYGAEGNMELVRGLISRLRAKIEETPKEPRYIITVPGLGYRLNAP